MPAGHGHILSREPAESRSIAVCAPDAFAFLIFGAIVFQCVFLLAPAQATDLLQLQKAFYQSPRVHAYYHAWSDYYATTSGGATLRQGQPLYPTEPGIVFLSAWMHTGEDRYLQSATAQFAFAHDLAGANGLLQTSAGYGRDPQARQIYNFYTAYKITGDAQYLQWADQAASGMAASIPRTFANIPNGGGFGAFFKAGFSNSGFSTFFDANQNAEVGLAYTLLYHEPNSAWYNSAFAQNVAANEITGALSLQDAASGAIGLTQNQPNDFDTAYGGYAAFSLNWANKFWNNAGWQQKIDSAGTDWLADFSSGSGQVADRYYPSTTSTLSSWDLWYRVPVLSSTGFSQPDALIDRYVTDFAPTNGVFDRGFQIFGYYDLLDVPSSYYLGTPANSELEVGFESPSFHTGAIAGQQEWFTTGALSAAAIVNESPLAGAQSLYLKGNGFARHSLLGMSLSDGTTIKWLQQITGGDWSTVSLNSSTAGGATFAQVEFNSNGDIFVLTDVGNVDIGNYSAGDIFEVLATLDFTNNQYEVVLNNVTAGSGPLSTGLHDFIVPTTFGQASAGEILLRMRSGGLFDNVEFLTPAGLLGDYNDDGYVDAADYTVWRNNFGDPDETDLNGNGDGGGVGTGDYTLWKSQYGTGTPPGGGGGLAKSTAVPEPTAGSLLLVLCTALSSIRCRHSFSNNRVKRSPSLKEFCATAGVDVLNSPLEDA